MPSENVCVRASMRVRLRRSVAVFVAAHESLVRSCVRVCSFGVRLCIIGACQAGFGVVNLNKAHQQLSVFRVVVSRKPRSSHDARGRLAGVCVCVCVSSSGATHAGLGGVPLNLSHQQLGVILLVVSRKPGPERAS